MYAISAHMLVRMRRFEVLLGQPYDWLARREPSARVGASIYVFDLRGCAPACERPKTARQAR